MTEDTQVSFINLFFHLKNVVVVSSSLLLVHGLAIHPVEL